MQERDWGDGDVNGEGGNVGCRQVANAKGKISRALEGLMRNEVSRLKRDVMWSANETGDGAGGGGNDIEGVIDAIVEGSFGERTAEEVIPEVFAWIFAVRASWLILEDWKAQFATKEGGVDIRFQV